MIKNDGGPAFPRPSSEAVDLAGQRFYPEAFEGMTLHDWFAGQALASGAFTNLVREDPMAAAIMCRTMADAMVATKRIEPK